MKKILSVFGVIMLVVVMLGGCGSSETSWNSKDAATETTTEETKSEKTTESKEEMDMEIADEEAKSPSFGGQQTMANGMSDIAAEALKNRKIIKSGNIYMETLEFDQTIDAIKVLMNKYGGYTSHSQVEGGIRNKEYSSRFASYTIKIPAENFELMYYDVQDVGHVLNANDSIEDVTSAITDIEARLTTLKIQEERMLDILAKLDNLEDIVELEYALQEVRYEIESYSANLRNIEERVRFSTITLRVQEVFEETIVVERPPTMNERITDGLDRTFQDIKESIENLIVYVITQFPYILMNILIIVVIFLIGRKIYKKNKKRLTVPEKGHESTIDIRDNKESDVSSKESTKSDSED